MRDFAQTGNGLNCAYFVVGKHNRGQISPVAKRLSKRRLVDHTAIGYVRIRDIESLASKRPRAVQHGRMLERRSHEAAFAALRFRLCTHASFYGPIIRFSTTRREIDFMRCGANERCDFLASPLNRSAGLASLRIERGGIAKRTAQKRLHGLKCRIGHARSSGVVQIHAPFFGFCYFHLRSHDGYASFAARRRDATSKSTMEFRSEQFSHSTQSSDASSQACGRASISSNVTPWRIKKSPHTPRTAHAA